MQNSLESLQELERKGGYVFHGSPFKIEIFEPRQAFNWVNGVGVPDGAPAIFASSVLNYAIFMAIVNKENCRLGSRSSSNGKVFKATKETLEQLTPEAGGYVYVFKKSDFKERTNGEEECVRYEPIQPLHSYRLTFCDITFPIAEL